jgi:hypothetical protein
LLIFKTLNFFVLYLIYETGGSKDYKKNI